MAMKIEALVLILISMNVSARESIEFANKVSEVHELSISQAKKLTQILTTTQSLTRNIGTEDVDVKAGPNNSWHMTTRKKCIDKVLSTGLIQQRPDFKKICGAPWMAPVTAMGQPLKDAKVCIDQFEFPNIPCEYPIVWVPPATAKAICESMGKRVCNSHEWEGACSGRARTTDSYRFDVADRTLRRSLVNGARKRVFAFQSEPLLAGINDTRQVCGVFDANDDEIDSPMRENLGKYYSSIGKSKTCNSGNGNDYQDCGTNSWPSGFKNLCKSANEVYDLHGNLAEVVNLPETEGQIADGKSQIGGTERKGSFFVYRPDYPDDCHVRQPYEHYGNYATNQGSYYQEGFRCCKDVTE